MELPVWASAPKVNDQWSVLSKLRTDVETVLGSGRSRASARAALLHDEEHGH
jgi:hypothetical protein